jgi:hypothetical protein
VLGWVPRRVTATMMTTAMRATIKAVLDCGAAVLRVLKPFVELDKN